MAANERLKKHEFCSSRKNVVVPTNSYGIRAAHAKLWHDFITVHTLDSSENTGSTGLQNNFFCQFFLKYKFFINFLKIRVVN